VLQPRQQAKLARGTEDKERAMSHKLNSAIAVVGINIGKNSFHVVGHDKRGAIMFGRLTKAVVVFNSDGGNLQAGIEIGKTIRLKSFANAVLDGFRCVSSCAFAWLGGSPRFMQRGAKIGFHAA
jgi:hypothetical protein